MRVLVTGASGLLGAHMLAGVPFGATAAGFDRHPWWGDRPAELRVGDLLSPDDLDAAMSDIMPDVVVHCAAMVNVDECERDPQAAFTFNSELTRRVVGSAPKGSLFVYINTDGLFGGERPFVDELTQPAPRTVYGRSKLEGELVVREATPHHLILRTNFYGWSSGRKLSSAEWLHNALAAGDQITAFDDFYFTPIYVCDLVEALYRLVGAGHRGVFNVCGGERVSKYDFAMKMAAQAILPTSGVRRGSVDDAHLAAPRPKDMSLDCTKVERVLGVPMPDCDTGLRRFLAHRNVPLSHRFTTTPDPTP